MALTAAVLVNLALAGPLAAPGPALLAGQPTPGPQATAAAAGPYVDDAGAPFPDRALPQRRGWAGPGRLLNLRAAETAALQAAVDRVRAEFGLNAVAVGVSIDGRLGWSGASGLGRDGVTPLDGNSPFGIASITKTFTAALVLELVNEGRLALDDEVGALLPDLGQPSGITVAQLLSHSSGLADLLAPLRDDLNAAPARRWTGTEVMGRLPRPWFAPGSDYGYSNTNYVLLGLLLERITGNAFSDELSRRLLQPYRLQDSGVLLSDGAPPLITPSWASAFGTSGSMYSSASDLVDWADALYRGHVLGRDTTQRMLAFNPDGYGLGAERVLLDGRMGYGHSGLLRGFTSLLVHLPLEDVTLVIIGTWQGFDPAGALTWSEGGQPSILDLAVAAAAAR